MVTTQLRKSENPTNDSGVVHSDSDQDFPLDDDQMMPMDDDAPILDDSHEENHNVRLSTDGTEAPGISFGDEDTTASKASPASKKRKKSAKSKKTKRRKVRDEATVLSSETIRANIADTSDITKEFVMPVSQFKSNAELLDEHLTTLQKLARPSLADKGDLAPELIELWESHNAVLFGKPFPYKLEEEPEEPEQARDANQDETVEEQEESLMEDDGGIPFDEDQQPPPMGDDEFPQDDNVPLMDEGEFADDRSESSVFSLGATNADYGDEDDLTTSTKWHKNTVKVLGILKARLENADSVNLQSDLFHKNVTRRTAAGTFFELLQLKTLDFIELNQDEAYGAILVSQGPKFGESPPE